MNDENGNGKQPVPVQYDPGSKTDLPIKIDPKTAKKLAVKLKKASESADAKTAELLGSKVIRIKTKHLAKLGKYAGSMGIKDIGHGRLLSIGSNADKSIAVCDAIVHELLTSGECDPDFLIAVMQLKRDFNSQLIDIATSHLKADKSGSGDSYDAKIVATFPCGQPGMIAVGPSVQAVPPLSIEAPQEKT